MTKRWLFAAACALALAACKTSSGSKTARGGAGSEGGGAATAQNAPAPQGGPARDPQDTAAEQAPSTRPQQGMGGHDPHPMTTENEQGQETYSGNAPQQPSLEGKTPPSRQDAGQGSQASAANAPPGQSPGAAGGQSQVSGKVALVDKDAHELAIDAGDVTTQVKVADDAEILINGQKGAFGDIRPGAEVRASLSQSGDTSQATRVEVTSKAKKK